MRDLLHTALEFALNKAVNGGADSMSEKEVCISALTNNEGSTQFPYPPLTIVNWTDVKTLPVTVQPVSVSFRGDRTYWLTGLSRDMGLSLADWMIRNGARNIVISSRDPKISQEWLQNAARRGATVMVIAW